MWNPAEDGVTHVNVYSKGKTPLGRWMSNFAKEPFTLSEAGRFDSVEGYWYWLTTHDDRLRSLSGFAAKDLGRSLPVVIRPSQFVFESCIAEALREKVRGNIARASDLRQCPLPFAHYYVFGPTVKDAGYGWILALWNDLRTAV